MATTIQLTIPQAGGATTIHVASLTYDLWQDYLHYRQEAESVDRTQEPLVYKRHVRAAVLAYFGYFEGVLNSWISKLDPAIDLDEESISFGWKLGFIRRKVGNNRQVGYLDVDCARNIRNIVVHPKPSHDDVETMEKLLGGQFFRDADKFTNWLDSASHALKMPRHPDVPALLKRFASALEGRP